MKTIIKKLWLGLVFIGLATAGFAAEIDDALLNFYCVSFIQNQ
jgi:hypothetical protein